MMPLVFAQCVPECIFMFAQSAQLPFSEAVIILFELGPLRGSSSPLRHFCAGES